MVALPDKERVLRIKIRLAQYEDALPMAQVIVDTFLSANRGIMSEWALRKREQEWTYEVSARNWEEAIVDIANGSSARSCIYVAEDETEGVVGLSMGCPSKSKDDPEEVGEVDILYVRESHQRQGIGRALVQAVAADLAQMGMTTIHIYTPVASTEARSFYKALGGRAIGTRDDVDDGEVIPLGAL